MSQDGTLFGPSQGQGSAHGINLEGAQHAEPEPTSVSPGCRSEIGRRRAGGLGVWLVGDPADLLLTRRTRRGFERLGLPHGAEYRC